MKASDFTEKRVRKIVKQSQEDGDEGAGSDIVDFIKDNPRILGLTGAGALGGGLIFDEGVMDRIKGSLIGGTGGAALGGALKLSNPPEMKSPDVDVPVPETEPVPESEWDEFEQSTKDRAEEAFKNYLDNQTDK